MNSLKLSKLYFILLGVFLMTACASGHCKGRSPVDRRVFIAKPDNSKQCEPTSGTSLDKMAEELVEIKIMSREKRSDGKMRMTVCGASTGMLNVYEIDAKDLEKATKLGYIELKK